VQNSQSSDPVSCKKLSTAELFSLVPLIWNCSHQPPDDVYFRRQLEQEIIGRQDKETRNRLIDLLSHSNVNYRFLACDLLQKFNSETVIAPLLRIFSHKETDLMLRRQAFFALIKYDEYLVRRALLEEYNRFRSSAEQFIQSNYVYHLKRYLVEKGVLEKS
jgi:hypothetical protein